MGKPRIDEIEAAIISAIQGAAAMSYLPDAQVQPVNERNVDFEGQEIIVAPPAVLVCYMGGEYEPVEITKHRHDIRESFLLIAVVNTLAGVKEATQGIASIQEGTYTILEDLKDTFAGLKLTMSGGLAWCHLVGTTVEGRGQGRIAHGLEIAVIGSWSNL